MRWACVTAALLLSGCPATMHVRRPGFACDNIRQARELKAAEEADTQRFQRLMQARLDAGTCVSLTPGEALRVQFQSRSNNWVGVEQLESRDPVWGRPVPVEVLWTPSTTLGQ